MMQLDDESDHKPSASARLLQAVKMKDTATPVKVKVAAPKPISSISTTPPSNSSLIYGNTTSQSNSAANAAAQLYMSQMAMSQLTSGALNFHSMCLPGMPFQQPLPKSVDMRTTANFQPIAPAPPKREAVTPKSEALAIKPDIVKNEPTAYSRPSSVTGSYCSDLSLSDGGSVAEKKADNQSVTTTAVHTAQTERQVNSTITEEVAAETADMLCVDDERQELPKLVPELPPNISMAAATLAI